jgi:hypothetical protein
MLLLLLLLLLLHSVWIEQADIGFPARTGGAYREARIFPNEVRRTLARVSIRVSLVSVSVSVGIPA